jgi:glycosyltransferase involved in cell wall biosynthesis
MSEFPNSIRLSAPVRITEQVWPEVVVPVVSICCITYQHVNFIRDAIEGFLMQETTFPVEIIIRDDASTDGTAEIVREYQEKFPQLIRTILHSENQYSLGKRAFPETYAMARGEFIAICEGDDYWISKEKLQKQVDLIEEHPEAVLCGARCLVCEEPNKTPYRIEPDIPGSILKNIKPGDYIFGKSYLRTPTRLLRSGIVKQFVEWGKGKNIAADWSLLLFCAWHCRNSSKGILFLDEPTAVYREHQGGVWTGIGNIEKAIWNLDILQPFTEIFKEQQLEHIKNIIDSNVLTLAYSFNLKADKRLKYCLKAICMQPFSYSIWKCTFSSIKNLILKS